MALVLNDRVKETTTTTGTGTVNLGGAATGFETFVAGVGNSNTTYYCITAGAEFEVGIGTVTDATPDTLSRTTILSSSNSDSAVDFSAGTKDVFCTLPASKAVFEDASSNVTLPGTLDVDGGITVDNITIDGTEIDLSSGNLTLDVAGNIELDADGGQVIFIDSGTNIGRLENSSSDFVIKSMVDDKDIIFKGEDGGSSITALTLDMSAGGKAVFANNIDFGDGHFIGNDSDDNLYIASSAGEKIRLDSPDEIILDADGGNITLTDGGTAIGQFQLNDTNHLKLGSKVSDADIFFFGNDGGSNVNALRLDMSDAGTATFNHDVKLGDNGILAIGDDSDLQLTHNNSNGTITNSTGDLTLDVAGDIILDADGGDIRFKDAGTEIGALENSSSDLQIKASVQDKDIIFRGNDGGSGINALTLDMSAAGAATFNNKLTAGDIISVGTASASGIGVALSDDNITELGKGYISLGRDDTADAPQVSFSKNGVLHTSLITTNNEFSIRSFVSNQNIIFQGNDGGSTITALTLDMSNAGAATFNGSVTANAGVVVDNITIDGTEIDLSSGDLTLDVAGDIILDADGENIKFSDAGTEVGQIDLGSQNFTLRSQVDDKDIIFRGQDGTSEIVALTLDMSDAGAATFNSNVTAFSDERLKDNIETLEDGLDKVEQLRGVTYTRDDKEEIGVIAQEVERILPEIVLTADDEMGTKSVDYSRITAVLIEAVKELSARVKELENK